MALLLWPDDFRRDGSEGLAARHPAMTRPLIERRDLNRRIRTRRRGYLPGSTHPTDWRLFWRNCGPVSMPAKPIITAS
jgi:hypothetical protein